jgi:hypothetical protein
VAFHNLNGAAMATAQARRPAQQRIQHTSADFLDDTAAEVMNQPLDMMASNVAQATLVGRLDPITVREMKEQAEYEAFMETPVVIEINETTDVNAPPQVYVAVNGDGRWLPRGVPVRLQRKFVERLAQAQEMRFSTVNNKDPDSDQGMKILRKTAQSYGFSVIQDNHPLGRRWLMRMQRSGS